MNRKLKIYFENRQDKKEISYKLKMLIRSSIEATLNYEGYENDCEVSVTFIDDEGIRELNKKFRNKDASTDVLSFPLFEYGDSEEPDIDEVRNNFGDIVLSLEHAEKQAFEFGHSFEREASFLTVHSMLHLMGYDHETSEEDEQEMREHQRGIMAEMGMEVK